MVLAASKAKRCPGAKPRAGDGEMTAAATAELRTGDADALPVAERVRGVDTLMVRPPPVRPCSAAPAPAPAPPAGRTGLALLLQALVGGLRMACFTSLCGDCMMAEPAPPRGDSSEVATRVRSCESMAGAAAAASAGVGEEAPMARSSDLTMVAAAPVECEDATRRSAGGGLRVGLGLLTFGVLLRVASAGMAPGLAAAWRVLRCEEEKERASCWATGA